jgi:tRNA(Arg) A34 adenosine deaminase TadA
MNQDEYYMSKAVELGREAMRANSGGPFGAVVVMDDKIVGEGKNTVTSGNDPTAHAEINAIRNACDKLGTFDLSSSTIYTSCEPCPMCLGAIYWARVEKVVFSATREDAAEIAGFDDAHFYEEISASWEERAIKYAVISRKEGIRLFEEWRAREDKTMY